MTANSGLYAWHVPSSYRHKMTTSCFYRLLYLSCTSFLLFIFCGMIVASAFMTPLLWELVMIRERQFSIQLYTSTHSFIHFVHFTRRCDSREEHMYVTLGRNVKCLKILCDLGKLLWRLHNDSSIAFPMYIVMICSIKLTKRDVKHFEMLNEEKALSPVLYVVVGVGWLEVNCLTMGLVKAVENCTELRRC